MRSSATSLYSKLKTDLLDCMDEMLGIENIRGCACEDLKEKVRSNAFNLVVVGQFKRGKTSLINALLGAEILSVAVVPLTSIVTIMTWGEALRIKVYFNDGKITEIKPESLVEYVTEKGNPKNVKDVREVVLTYPSPYLKDGVCLYRYARRGLDLPAQYGRRVPVFAEIGCRTLSSFRRPAHEQGRA